MPHTLSPQLDRSPFPVNVEEDDGREREESSYDRADDDTHYRM